MEWSEHFLNLEFKPRMVEEITGYSSNLQRKWAGRYFGKLRVLGVISGDPGEHRTYSWVGLQALTVFGDVLKDLENARDALAAMDLDPIVNIDTVLHREPLQTYFFDWRRDPKKDLLIVRDMAAVNPAFVRIGAENIKFSERQYIYNISAMQRRLCQRLEDLDITQAA